MSHSSKRRRTEIKRSPDIVDQRVVDQPLHVSLKTNISPKKEKKKYLPDEDLDFPADDISLESVKGECPIVEKTEAEEEEELIAEGSTLTGDALKSFLKKNFDDFLGKSLFHPDTI
ncbi:unnamed protein product [Phytomonas sp. EM1]|nr:unnamed protein product [Phytomonas sp. EM1]|eukprot:CCW60179.1 unnamed protein product [Phytomonas sp. isolate EM1]